MRTFYSLKYGSANNLSARFYVVDHCLRAITCNPLNHNNMLVKLTNCDKTSKIDEVVRKSNIH